MTVGDLKKLAKKDPRRFLTSAALDVLLERRVSPPRTVWSALAEIGARPEGLLPAADVITRSYAFDRAPDSSRWLIRVLAQSSAIRPVVLEKLLGSPGSAIRLACYLASDVMTPAKGAAKHPSVEAVGEWIVICGRGLKDRSLVRAALLLLGVFRLVSASDPARFPPALVNSLVDCTKDVEQLVLATLQTTESGNAVKDNESLLVVNGEQLYQGVQSYLQRLPSGAANDGDPARALRFERYMGRKDVIAGLLSALNEELSNESLRDAVEVALFNAGVRQAGEAGEETMFDHDFHDPMVPGILPGDRVSIVKPGRTLGSHPDLVVLAKAHVTRAASQTSGETKP